MTYTFQLSVFLTLTGLGATAFAGGPIDTGLDQELIPWPLNLSTTDDFRSIQMGDLDGNNTADGLVLVGTELVFLPSIDDYTAPSILLDTAGLPLVSDQVSLLPSNSPGGLTSIASVGPSGLQILRWNPVSELIEVQSTTVGKWLNAREVHVVDWDNDGAQDILALSSDGKQVLIRLSAGGTWVDDTPVDLTMPSSDMVPVLWDAGERVGVAVLNPLGLEVYKNSGQLNYARGTPFTSGGLARVQTGGPIDSLAWLTGPNSNGDSFLASLNSSGMTGALLVPDLVANRVSAGDYDGDGDSDLVISFTNSAELWLVEWDKAGLSSSSQALRLVPESPGIFPTNPEVTGGNPVVPVLADSNLDGKLDVILLQQNLHRMVIFHGQAVWSASLLVADERRIEGFSHCIDPLNGEGRLSASFTYDATIYEDFDEFEVTLWKQPSPSDYVEQFSLSTCPLPDSGAANHLQSVEVDIPACAFGTAAQENNYPTIYFVTVEPVDIDKKSVGPAIHAAFAINRENTPAWLAAPGAAVEVLELFGACDTSSGVILGTIVAGGALGSTRRGPHAPTKPPRRRPKCTPVTCGVSTP